MHRYAQIDIESGICIGVSTLSGEVQADHMIPLPEDSVVKPGDVYLNGEWTHVDPPDYTPEPDRITQLEAENADLKSRVADMELAFADIITGGGV